MNTRLSLVFATALLLLSRHSVAVCSPVEQWVWDGATRSPSAPGPSTTIVVRLTDTNGDGRIDGGDVPDVVFLHGMHNDIGQLITAVDGRDGSEHFTITSPNGLGFRRTGLAAADIDGDGFLEILAIEGLQGDTEWLVAFENTGALKWVSDPFWGVENGAAIGIADLDQDGTPEIYVGPWVFRANGTIRGHGTSGTGSSGPEPISNAADVVASNPGLEVIAGATAYDANAAIVWDDTLLQSGRTAVADFDGDGVPEIVLQSGTVTMLDNLGSVLGSTYWGSGIFGFPAIGDIDGDGRPELVASDENILRVLEWNGSGFALKWSQPDVDIGNFKNGPALFDFDGDGKAEVVYHDRAQLYLFDGTNGSVLFSVPLPSRTDSQTPIIADIDNDCKTEIIVGPWGAGLERLVAYKCQEPGVAARSIWNQFQYHVTNINDDGTVPQFEMPSWQGHNGWLSQVAAVAVPQTLGNTLRARRVAGDVVLSWGSSAAAHTYALYRGTVKGIWPSPGLLSGLVTTAATVPDIAAPPALYFYRTVGANCSGVEGP